MLYEQWPRKSVIITENSVLTSVIFVKYTTRFVYWYSTSVLEAFTDKPDINILFEGYTVVISAFS